MKEPEVRIKRAPIQDEFTRLPISKQRKYQLRRQRDLRCTMCGEPATQGSRCLKHLIAERERQRAYRRSRRRYYGTLSYRLQTLAKSEAVRPGVVANRRARVSLVEFAREVA
jgi:hypothetical protein